MQRKEMLDIYEGHLAAVWNSGRCGRRGNRGGAQVSDPPDQPHSGEKGDVVGLEKSRWSCWRQERKDLLDTGKG